MRYNDMQNKKNFIISVLGDDYISASGAEMRYQCPFCKEQADEVKGV